MLLWGVCFLEIVGARGQLAFQGLFLALIFGGGFAFLGNEIGGVRRHWSGFLRFPGQLKSDAHSLLAEPKQGRV